MQKIDPECYLIINAIEHEGQFDGQIIPQTQPNSLPWPEARLFVGLHAVQVVGNGWGLKGAGGVVGGWAGTWGQQEQPGQKEDTRYGSYSHWDSFFSGGFKYSQLIIINQWTLHSLVLGT